MNTSILHIVCLTIAQLQPAPFDPGKVISPASPAPIAVEPADSANAAVDAATNDAASSGGSFRLTEEPLALPSVPAAPAPEPLPELRPRQFPSTPAAPAPTATLAQAESPIIPVHSSDLEALAAMILDGAMQMPLADATDIALVDILQRVADTRSRQQAVQTYWRLCMAIAEQNFARHEARYLTELARPQTQLEELLLTADATRARAREATMALEVLELQENLKDLSRLDLQGLPRPADRPFVGPYHTHLRELFANRPAPTRLRRIDRRLPHQLEVIERRAEAVAAGERASSQLAEAYKGGSVGLNYVLESLNHLSRSRRELLSAVLSYNEQIAEYSLAVVRPGSPPESLVGTLIRREVAARPTIVADNRVRRASAEEPIAEEPVAASDESQPLRPIPAPQTTTQPAEPEVLAPESRSVLKRTE